MHICPYPPRELSPEKFAQARTLENFGGNNFGAKGPPENFPSLRKLLGGGSYVMGLFSFGCVG